jgi:cation transport ATPase
MSVGIGKGADIGIYLRPLVTFEMAGKGDIVVFDYSGALPKAR